MTQRGPAVLSGVSPPSLKVPMRTGSPSASLSNNLSWSRQEPHIQAARWEQSTEREQPRDSASLWTSAGYHSEWG